MRNPLHIISKLFANLGHRRSSQWPTVRKEYLMENPQCAACGSTLNLEVHHIKSFHLFPELELDKKNLLTLCERVFRQHHFRLGHSLNGKPSWKINNPNVVQEATALRKTLL